MFRRLCSEQNSMGEGGKSSVLIWQVVGRRVGED